MQAYRKNREIEHFIQIGEHRDKEKGRKGKPILISSISTYASGVCIKSLVSLKGKPIKA
jgi:hypothetical protein